MLRLRGNSTLFYFYNFFLLFSLVDFIVIFNLIMLKFYLFFCLFICMDFIVIFNLIMLKFYLFFCLFICNVMCLLKYFLCL